MARQSADRDDLFADLTACSARWELNWSLSEQSLVVGLRENGWLTVYFDQDCYYQFNVQGQLRRAYRDGELYRSQGTTLARLKRERNANESLLLRADLNVRELQQFRKEMSAAFQHILVELEANRLRVTRFARLQEFQEPAFSASDDLPGRALLQKRFQDVLIADPWLAPAMGPR